MAAVATANRTSHDHSATAFQKLNDMKSHPQSQQRSLLLAPPSLASHPDALSNVLSSHDRQSTDLQMLDRLRLGLVSLPDATYDLVLLLSDVDGSRKESSELFDRAMLAAVVKALRVGGRLQSQDGTFGSVQGPERTEGILAGLVEVRDQRDANSNGYAGEGGGGGMIKPEVQDELEPIPLKLGRKNAAESIANKINGKGKSIDEGGATNVDNAEPNIPAGVGFSDDFEDPIIDDDLDLDDGDLIDEDELLTEEDKTRKVVPPPECQPTAPGKKRRRACKDCTCGLAAKIAAEDTAKRAAADETLKSLHATNAASPNGGAVSMAKSDAAGGPNAAPRAQKGEKYVLDVDDLAEVDFTVPGKVGSCGNCALGDAFRCDGCPYVGMPAFKPGEEVRLTMDDDI
ncbi:MAG: electron carrier [Alyxoria varia]|nr:MAG: electron carrier [Alyxoria varia]